MASRKIKKKHLIYEADTLASLLFEQDLFGDEGDEEGGEDEAAEEEGGEDEAAEEAPADEGEEGEEGEEGDDAAEEEEKLDVDLEDEVKLSKSIDQDLEALLIDFETDARKSKEIKDTETEAAEEVAESLHLGMLLEQDDYEKEIDLDRFTAEVARLVKNYTSLLDMEKMLVSKAREFVATRYGTEAEAELVDTLNSKHDIEIDTSPVASGDEPEESTPIAVGAGTGAAGGTGG